MIAVCKSNAFFEVSSSRVSHFQPALTCQKSTIETYEQ